MISNSYSFLFSCLLVSNLKFINTNTNCPKSKRQNILPFAFRRIWFSVVRFGLVCVWGMSDSAPPSLRLPVPCEFWFGRLLLDCWCSRQLCERIRLDLRRFWTGNDASVSCMSFLCVCDGLIAGCEIVGCVWMSGFTFVLRSCDWIATLIFLYCVVTGIGGEERYWERVRGFDEIIIFMIW